MKNRLHNEPLLLLSLLLAIALMLSSTHSSAAELASCFGKGLPVIIIDPGHGGMDGGASGASGVTESAVNLEISLTLEQLLAFLGVPTILTRRTEELDYPPELETIRARKVWDQKTRVSLIQSYPEAVLISIHQNYYPSAKPSGPQVLFGANGGSELLGTAIQAAMTEHLRPSCSRKAEKAPENIYLMRQVSCTAVLIECGFLSNLREEALLRQPEYQIKLDMAIASALIAYCLGERI